MMIFVTMNLGRTPGTKAFIEKDRSSILERDHIQTLHKVMDGWFTVTVTWNKICMDESTLELQFWTLIQNFRVVFYFMIP